jgi:translation initiation factor eIF-2B subunit alpha
MPDKENISNNYLTIYSPMCDFTPPELITLLFSDKGIFNLSAVSDELM